MFLLESATCILASFSKAFYVFSPNTPGGAQGTMATLTLSQVKNKQAVEMARLNEEIDKLKSELTQEKRSSEEAQSKLESLQAMDPAGLQQQLAEATEIIAELEHQQQLSQIERMETFMEIQTNASQKQDDLKSMSEELREVKAELKSLKELNPDRLKKKVDEQKKKITTKTSENKKLIADNNSLKTKLRELKKELEEAKAKIPEEELETEASED